MGPVANPKPESRRSSGLKGSMQQPVVYGGPNLGMIDNTSGMINLNQNFQTAEYSNAKSIITNEC